VTLNKDFDSLHAISPGRHFYQFYKHTDDFLSVMGPYFEAGLQRGDACLWLVSQRHNINFNQIITEITDRHYLLAGQFQILSAEDWYLDGTGTFSEEKALENAENYLKSVFEKGFKCLRAAGDAGAIPRKDWLAVAVYEEKAQAIIRSNAVIALCAYPILECTPSQTKQVLELHDDVLVGKW
jgi:hypothetical protein